MHPLALDYLGRRRRTKPLAYVLALIAAGLAGDMGYRYHALRADVAAMESRLPRLAGSERVPAGARAQRVSAEELEALRGAGQQLRTPWSELFRALEASRAKDVALLSIEPDARERTIRISGEAKDYLTVLTYLSALGEQRALHDVRLTRHETRAGALRIAFTVSARWTDAQ